jgi:hypothetical protein
LVEKLGEHLILQEEAVFHKTVAELLQRWVICVWKPCKSAVPKPRDPLWSAGYLKDNWIDTDQSETKFESNLKFLAQQPAVADQRFFYRVECLLGGGCGWPGGGRGKLGRRRQRPAGRCLLPPRIDVATASREGGGGNEIDAT